MLFEYFDAGAVSFFVKYCIIAENSVTLRLVMRGQQESL